MAKGSSKANAAPGAAAAAAAADKTSSSKKKKRPSSGSKPPKAKKSKHKTTRGPHEQVWEERFQQLTEYKRRHGNCIIPLLPGLGLGPTGERTALYYWVETQRRRKRAGTLKQERIERLNALDFSWQIGKRGANSKRSRSAAPTAAADTAALTTGRTAAAAAAAAAADADADGSRAAGSQTIGTSSTATASRQPSSNRHTVNASRPVPFYQQGQATTASPVIPVLVQLPSANNIEGLVIRATLKLGKTMADAQPHILTLQRQWISDARQLNGIDLGILARYVPLGLAVEMLNILKGVDNIVTTAAAAATADTEHI